MTTTTPETLNPEVHWDVKKFSDDDVLHLVPMRPMIDQAETYSDDDWKSLEATADRYLADAGFGKHETTAVQPVADALLDAINDRAHVVPVWLISTLYAGLKLENEYNVPRAYAAVTSSVFDSMILRVTDGALVGFRLVADEQEYGPKELGLVSPVDEFREILDELITKLEGMGADSDD